MKVVFVGGSQALRLAHAAVHPGVGAEVATYAPDFAAADREQADALGEADRIVWLAPRRLLAPERARELAGRLLWVAPLQLDFLWPFGVQPHPCNAPDAFHPDGPFPAELGDAWLNRALQGLSLPQAAQAAYLALDVARVVDLDRMRAMALEDRRLDDAALGLDLAARIEADFKQPGFFLSPRTPGAAIFAEFAGAVFARLGLSFVAAAAEPPTPRALPAHPSVAAHFGLAPSPAAGWEEGVDFAEYVRRYLSYAEGPQGELGLARLARGEFAAAVEALQIAVARPMGARAHSLTRGLARARLRAAGVSPEDAETALARGDSLYSEALAAAAAGRWREAERALVAFAQRAEPGAEDFVRLADIRDRLGDAEGAFAALELAAGLAPQDAALAQALATRAQALPLT